MMSTEPVNPYLPAPPSRPRPAREAPLSAHGQPLKRIRRPLYSEGRPPVAIPERDGGYAASGRFQMLPTPLNIVLARRGANARVLSDAALVEHRIVESLCAGAVILWGPGHVIRIAEALGLPPSGFLTADQLTHLWSKL